jgi:HEPN domain-containing protein
MNYGFEPYYQSSWIYSLFRFHPRQVLEVAIKQALLQLKAEEKETHVLEHRSIQM